jgi:hypothetical protein
MTLSPDQLLMVARTLTPDQLDAAMRLLIDADRRLAHDVIDAAIAECPIGPDNRPRRLASGPETAEARDARHQALAVRRADQAAQEAREAEITARARRNRGPR